MFQKETECGTVMFFTGSPTIAYEQHLQTCKIQILDFLRLSVPFVRCSNKKVQGWMGAAPWAPPYNWSVLNQQQLDLARVEAAGCCNWEIIGLLILHKPLGCLEGRWYQWLGWWRNSKNSLAVHPFSGAIAPSNGKRKNTGKPKQT